MEENKKVAVCQHCKEMFTSVGYEAMCSDCTSKMARRAAENKAAAVKRAKGVACNLD